MRNVTGIRDLKLKLGVFRLSLVPPDDTFKERVEITNLDTFGKFNYPVPKGVGDVGEIFTALTHLPCVSYYKTAQNSYIVIGFVG